MPRASETGQRKFRLRHRAGRSKPQEGRNADLEQLLTELAFVLLPRGITPERFSKLAHEAFIRAAAERSLLRNGRINRSKVAALTGLSRREIKRVLDLDTTSLEPDHSARTPSERVVQGWLIDPRFLTKRGHPKTLAIRGLGSSFQRLVKEYGGDISPRAILEELRRSRAVRNVGHRVELRVSKLSDLKARLGSFTRVIPTLIDGLRIASVESKSKTGSLLYRLRLHANSETELSLIRKRCLSGIQSLLHGLDDSLQHQLTIPTRRRTFRRALNVTVLLADTRIGHSSNDNGTI